MPDNKKPETKVVPFAKKETPAPAAQKAPAASVVPPVQLILSDEQLAGILHATLVGNVVGGYLASGGRTGSIEHRRLIRQAVEFARELL